MINQSVKVVGLPLTLKCIKLNENALNFYYLKKDERKAYICKFDFEKYTSILIISDFSETYLIYLKL